MTMAQKKLTVKGFKHVYKALQSEVAILDEYIEKEQQLLNDSRTVLCTVENIIIEEAKEAELLAARREQAKQETHLLHELAKGYSMFPECYLNTH